jgi:hypothetical protein
MGTKRVLLLCALWYSSIYHLAMSCVYAFSKPSGVEDILFALYFLSSIIPMFGYVYRKAILSQNIWRMWVIVSWVWISSHNVWMVDIEGVRSNPNWALVLSFILNSLADPPKMIMAILYAFNSKDIWERRGQVA